MNIKTPFLAIWSIAILLMPAAALYYIEQYQLETVELALNDQGLGIVKTGNYINSLEYNETFPTTFPNDVDNLLFSYGYPGGSLIPTNGTQDTILARHDTNQARIGKNITIINNTNYVFLNDVLALVPSQAATYIFHWLNITTHELAALDGLIINTTQNNSAVREWGLVLVRGAGFVATHIEYPTNFVGSQIISFDNGTHYIGISNSLKLELLSHPEGRVWFYYTDFLPSLLDLQYSFQIEEADTTDIFSIEPLILAEIFLAIIVAVSSVWLIFSTDLIDIKLDRGRRR